MPRRRDGPLKGLIHPGPNDATVVRYLPRNALAPLVEHYWIARWHVPEGVSTISELSYPAPCASGSHVRASVSSVDR
jgi:hypothetical protein